MKISMRPVYSLLMAAFLTASTWSLLAEAHEKDVSVRRQLLNETDSSQKPLSFFQAEQKEEVSALFSSTEGEHVPVGERRLSSEDYLKIQERRALLTEERDPNSSLAGIDDEELIVKKNYYTSHPGVFHHPIAITALGDYVTLDDGSGWQVKDKDRIKTLDWLAGDSIIILPNHAWFSSYYYVLHNQNTGNGVQVNLTMGPIYNGIYTHWIVAIDYYNKELCLEDGSVWSISGGDEGTMKKWLVNDTIIIGINDSWFSNKPNILINVNMLNNVAAICIN